MRLEKSSRSDAALVKSRLCAPQTIVAKESCFGVQNEVQVASAWCICEEIWHERRIMPPCSLMMFDTNPTQL